MIIKMYVTLLPAIMAGIANMIWCKIPFVDCLKRPVDGGKNFTDGKRIFGDNKTWKGFVGMILFGCIFSVLWGEVCSLSGRLENLNFMYASYENTLLYNMLIGVLFGFSYALFELPNSFLKRRLNIKPGKTCNGFKKIFFIFLDQADSVFGMVLVVCIFYPMSIQFYFLYVLIGAVTHILLNIILYCFKLRKNMF